MKKLLVIVTLLALVGCQNHSQSTKTNNESVTVVTTTPSPLTKLKQNPWRFVQKESSITIPFNQRIGLERDKLVKNKVSFERLISRSEPYMYYIINQLHQRNMPVELALIPLIESAYNPQATSSAKAAGLWQIVPITAKAYGMTSNKWYDPRRDLVESTDAALNYLQYLNQFFDGDWLLTLAAYNSGEGRVKRAQQWNKSNGLPTHFWALNLPKETMQYIPKLLAIIDIIRNNQRYDIRLPDCDYNNALVKINIGKQIKLEAISQYSEISLDELATYNAAYLKKTLNGPYHLLVPNNQAQSLYDNLVNNNFANAEIVDLISLPAKENQFKSYNIKTTNNKYLTVTDQDLQYYAKEHLRHSQIIYRVKPGDNLYQIAKTHRVNVTQLLKWNNIKNADRLKPGDRLVINIRN